MRPIVPILVVLALSSAGCLALPEDMQPQDAAPAAATGPASISGKESRAEASGLCEGAGLGLGGSGGDRFCATRTITVTGDVSGLRRLAVTLDSFNGDVAMGDADEGEWGFVAVLEGRGESEAEAKSRLDSIAFSWRADEERLEVTAEKDGESEGRSAEITARLPRSILLELAASTTNGDVSAIDVRTDGLSLRTTNGAAEARAEVTHVDMGTTNGDVEATLRPTSSGRISVATTNGEIDLSLPEDANRGYQLEGATTNGEVEITLRDGQVGPCPEGSEYYTPPCNHRTFETSGFRGRAIQTYVEAASTNGDVNVQPA